MEKEIFEVAGGGFGYRVGNVMQEYDPEKEGFVLMDRERAEKMAAELEDRLNHSQTGPVST